MRPNLRTQCLGFSRTTIWKVVPAITASRERFTNACGSRDDGYIHPAVDQPLIGKDSSFCHHVPIRSVRSGLTTRRRNRARVLPFVSSLEGQRLWLLPWSLPRGALSTSWTKSVRFMNSRSNLPPTTFVGKQLTPRKIADLEDFLYETVAQQVIDPVLNQSLASLQWFHRRIAFSSSFGLESDLAKKDPQLQENSDVTVSILLKLPTLLHPLLNELKQTVQQTAQQQVHQWLIDQGYRTPLSTSQHTNNNNNNSIQTVSVQVQTLASKPIPTMARLVQDHDELIQQLGPGLTNIAHFIAVYSCKGGVGKSTVAVNLAYELIQQGGRVGLLDVDLYGPSLPVLIRPVDVSVRPSPIQKGMIYPIHHAGLKCMSLGFVSRESGVPGSGEGNGATVMRGPLAGKVVSQLLKGTDWGDLDVLILDLPPGTGDVQLAVLQDLQLSGAVAVTTPSTLATADTIKGIEMFTSLGVPTIAVVENMAYFECEGGIKHYPFGRGFAAILQHHATKTINPDQIVQLPISTVTNHANDTGNPLCLNRSTTANVEVEHAAFQQLGKIVARALLETQYNTKTESLSHWVVFHDDNHGRQVFDAESIQLSIASRPASSSSLEPHMFVVRFLSDQGALQQHIQPSQLRCRDPKTGYKIHNSPYRIDDNDNDDGIVESTTASSVIVHQTKVVSRKPSPSISPTRVTRKGRYGYAVEWADGATIIYSMISIARASGGLIDE